MIPQYRPLVIPEAPLEPPAYDEEEPVLSCAWCGEGIYAGDDYYEIEGSPVCCECISNCCKEAERSA